MKNGWPAALYLTRHAESAGNVARTRALAEHAETIDIASPDRDVPLSHRGRSQAAALGHWLARSLEPLDVVLSSPYARARQTAEIALASAGWNDVRCVVDERLREKAFGSLDRLTRIGIERRYPQEAASRAATGKFHYRPPGGESWADVVLRVRSAVESLRLEYAGKRALIVAHQVVILCLRYVIEDMDEAQILAIDRAGEIANCSLTTYERDRASGKLLLRSYNASTPLEAEGEAVTAEPPADLQ